MKKFKRILPFMFLALSTVAMVGCGDDEKTFVEEMTLKDTEPKDRGMKAECRVLDLNGAPEKDIGINDVKVVGFSNVGYFNANEETRRIGYKEAVVSAGGLDDFLSGLSVDKLGKSNKDGYITKTEKEKIIEDGEEKEITVDLGCTVVKDLVEGKEVEFIDQKIKGTFRKAGLPFSTARALQVIGLLNKATSVQNISARSAIKIFSALGINDATGVNSPYSGYLAELKFKSATAVTSTDYDNQGNSNARISAAKLEKIVFYFQSDEVLEYSPNFLEAIDLYTGELVKEVDWSSLGEDGVASDISISY